MALSKKAARKIASLINHIECAHIAKAMEPSNEDKQYWYEVIAQSTVELSDSFGIELPCIHQYRKQIADSKAGE